jgi:hypothetical protein
MSLLIVLGALAFLMLVAYRGYCVGLTKPPADVRFCSRYWG